MGFISTMMKSSATLYRAAIGRDSAGGVTQDFSDPYASDLPCCVAMGGGVQTILYGQRNTGRSCTVYFADNPNVQINDKAVIIDMYEVSRTYLLKGEAQPLGDRAHTWQVSAEYIDSPGVTPI